MTGATTTNLTSQCEGGEEEEEEEPFPLLSIHSVAAPLGKQKQKGSVQIDTLSTSATVVSIEYNNCKVQIVTASLMEKGLYGKTQ